LAGGDTVRVTVVATNPHQDELSYTWSADYGRFIGRINATSVQWEAPIRGTKEDYVIEVIVSDGVYIAEGDITIYVDKSPPLTVTTTEITDITETSARVAGEVTDDGGSYVTARGVVWSRSSNPILPSSEGYTTDGSGIGSFTSNITGLNPRTNYYVRAYATNSQDTAYGNQVSFRTGGYENSTITDIDGNVYRTVKIGEQWWMAENLRVTRYRNGDAIPTNFSDDEWRSTRYGAYAIYPHSLVDGINSDAEMVAAYGKLYNWFAVDDSRGLCPPGWHVPSVTDWMTLTNYLDGISIAGGKMKSTRTEPEAHPRWNSPNRQATNESGFSGLPGGGRYDDGFGYLGEYGSWWSSSETYLWHAWRRIVGYDRGDVGWYFVNQKIGFSVRCRRND